MDAVQKPRSGLRHGCVLFESCKCESRSATLPWPSEHQLDCWNSKNGFVWISTPLHYVGFLCWKIGEPDQIRVLCLCPGTRAMWWWDLIGRALSRPRQHRWLRYPYKQIYQGASEVYLRRAAIVHAHQGFVYMYSCVSDFSVVQGREIIEVTLSSAVV